MLLLGEHDFSRPEMISAAVVVDVVGLDVTKVLEQLENVVPSDLLAEVGEEELLLAAWV